MLLKFKISIPLIVLNQIQDQIKCEKIWQIKFGPILDTHKILGIFFKKLNNVLLLQNAEAYGGIVREG